MAREQQLKDIDTKYAQQMNDLQDAINQAQVELNGIIGQKQILINEVNEYYDAIDTKQRVDVIVAKGAPVI